MCGITVRQIRAEDIAVVAALERKNFSEPWSNASFEAELKNRYGITLVAENKGVVCGYINAYLVCGNLHINTFCVAGEKRGNGIGTALLKTLFECASSPALEDATLEVRQGNKEARALYDKFGFVQVGIRKRFYKDPIEDAVLMKRSFNS